MHVLVGAGVEDPPLLERADELSALEAALAAVAGGRRGQMVLMGGEAGIGKTLLLRRFCEEASARVLWAACDPLFTPRPLGPLLDVARDAAPELQARLEEGAPPHDVAAALLDELAGPAPNVLVIEDLHWADEATFDVVRLVARRIERVPALLAVSYRDEQVHRTHPLRLLLGELRGAQRLDLQALSPEAVATLAEPAGLDARELHRRTEGNPFFVTEAVAAGGQRIPDTVRDAVLARAARLTMAARALVDAIAVVPQRVELWLLEALVQVPPGAVDECLASGILKADGDRVAFRHELARLAVEESLAPDRRLALHRLALIALADPPAGVPELARLAHHAQAAGDAEAVLRYAPAAAEQAAAVGAHREAQAQYGRALRFADAVVPESRADLLVRFAGEGFLTDMRIESIEALEEANAIYRESGDAEKLSEALRLRSRLLSCAGLTAEAHADALEAVAVLEDRPDGPQVARAYALMAGVAMSNDDPADAIAWGDRAIAVAERVGDTEALVLALNYVGTSQLARGLEDGRHKLDRSLEIALTAGRMTDVGLAYINVCAALGRRRRWKAVDDYLGPGIEYCSEHGLEAWVSCLVALEAESHVAQARWTEATEAAARILDRAPDGVTTDRYSALTSLACVRARRGDPGSWPLLDEAAALARSFDELQFIGPIAAARAEAAWLEGRSEAIAQETDTALALAVASGEAWLAAELACWRRRAGIVEEPPAGEGPFALLLAGEHRAAARQLGELSCPYDAALALADADDEDTLRQALDELQALGAAPAAAIVARRLRERGARGLPRGPRRRTRENPAGLTSRELEVLALLTHGLSNAEIAQRLVLSEKTVGHHVSAILRKLDVPSRARAAAKASRLGLVES